MPKQKGGYLLPPENDIETPARVCVQFEIPDTPEYRAALLGQIFELGKWWAWDKGNKGQDDRGSRAAKNFLHALAGSYKFMEECPDGGNGGDLDMFDIRVVGCILEKSDDGGMNWTPVKDLSQCQDPPLNFAQVDCTLTADGQVIFDASCAEYEPPPADTPEETNLPPVVGNPKYCAGAKYLVDLLFAACENIVDEWVLKQSDVIAFTNVVTLGLYKVFEDYPLTGALVSLYEGLVNHGHLSKYTYLSSPSNREKWECVVYCAAKNNQGFNEGAWTEIMEEMNVPFVNLGFLMTDEQWVGVVLRLLIGYKPASKKFLLGSYNEDNTCEAVCIDCADQDWSQNALDPVRIQNYLDGHYSDFTNIIAGEFDAGLTRLQTDGTLIHVIWDFAGMDLALWKTGANGITRILPFPQQLEMYIRVRNIETGEWSKEWTRLTGASGISATVEPGYWFDAVEYYAPQIVAYSYESGNFGRVNDFTFFGKRLNPFIVPPP